jgi:predicted deacylase
MNYSPVEFYTQIWYNKNMSKTLSQTSKQTVISDNFLVNYTQNGKDQFFEIPFTVVDSGAPGQTYVFTGGIHGDEIGGSKIVEEVIKYFKKGKLLKGKVILFPRLNPLALDKKMRRFPETGEDLNRCFTDNPDTVGEKIAAQIITKINSFKPDYLIDIHNDWKFSIPYTILDKNQTGDSIYEKSLSMAKYIDFPMIQETETIPKTLSGYFYSKKIPALTLEIGGDREVYRKFLNIGRNAILNLLYKEKMVQFSFKVWLAKFRSPRKISGKTLFYKSAGNPVEAKDVKSVTYKVRPKKIVKEGQVLCVVVDKNNKKHIVVSPVSGIVLAHNEKTPVYPETEVYALGSI